MKHLVLCAGLSVIMSVGAWGQQTLPTRYGLLEHHAQLYIQGANFVGYQQQLAHLLHAPHITSNAPYWEMISALMSQGFETAEELYSTFVDKYPASVDRARVTLLMGSVYLSRGAYAQAKDILGQIDEHGLSDAERAEYTVYLVYIALHDPKLDPSELSHLRASLERAMTSDSIWGEQALLLLATLEWYEGRPHAADKILTETSWSSEIAPEAAYQRALLGYERLSPSEAIRQTEVLWRQYPELARRARLVGSVGIAHYGLGDESMTIATLSPLLSKGDMTAEEAYALGAALYKKRDYKAAREALALAAHPTRPVGALAHILQGNMRLEEGRVAEALLAFSAAASHPGASAEAKEYAIYNSIKASGAGQSSDFGQRVRLYEQYLREFPSSPRRRVVYDELAVHLAQSKDYAASLDVIGRLTDPPASIRGTQQYLLTRLGELYIQQDKPELWERYLNEAIALGEQGPHYVEAIGLMSKKLLEQGSYQDARHTVLKGLKVGSGDRYSSGILYYILGYCEYNLEKYTEAAKAFARFQELSPDEHLRSDALLRLADCKLSASGPTDEVIGLYKRSNELRGEGNAEALYQLQHLYGRRSRYTEQIKSIEELMSKHPTSPFVAEALYDKGRAELLGGSLSTQAEQTFASVVDRFPNTRVARLASLDRAMLLYNSSKVDQAIAIYKQLIQSYPTSAEARTALSDLKTIYAAESRMDEYAAYANGLGGGLKPSDEEAGHLEFLSAKSLHQRADAAAEKALQGFINRYPAHQDADKARLLLAKQYLGSASNLDESLRLLTHLSKPQTEPALRLEALELLADLQTNRGQHAEALNVYKQLYAFPDISIGEKQRAGLAVSRLAMKQANHALCSRTATEVLKLTPLAREMEDELILLLGKSLEGEGKTKEAIKTYEQLSKRLDSPYGAETYVLRAGILYRGGGIRQAKELLDSFISQGSSQQYWMARAFILLSDCYIKLGDKYAAEQYLTSLKENYKGEEQDIAQMIEQRMNQFSKKK